MKRILVSLALVAAACSRGPSDGREEGKRTLEASLARLESEYAQTIERMGSRGVDTGTLQKLQAEKALIKSRIERIKAKLAEERLDASSREPASTSH